MNRENISIDLEARNIGICEQLPDELSFMGNALQHQVDVFKNSHDADIILDLAPTGTGKTKAGLSVLLHQPNKSAVYIAPTNALIEQQTEAAQKFVLDAGLNHVVKAASAKEIKTWSNKRVGKRAGEKLYNVLRNPATIFPEVSANRPILLVTNPDIFYYATFFSYNPKDRNNVATNFFTKFSTVIFDEFHLYDAKQLVSLLFYLAYSHIFGFFQHGRKVILLTATPEPACNAALESLEKQGVRIARINGESSNSRLIPSQTSVKLELRPKPDQKSEFLQTLADEICQYLQQQPHNNGAVILDSKNNVDVLANLLKKRGLADKFGRITGSTPQLERKSAAQKQIILATSTVDVGFNFERHPQTARQSLDWLIFSARNRAAFWQRIGRVGRILGKSQTNIPSKVIAYLPEKAWDEGLSSLDTSRGRDALKVMLENLPCLDKPFLHAYWRSEAFLEIARPLLELENKLQNLAGSEYIPQLFNSLQEILGGKRDWQYYRCRMKKITGAENVAKASFKELKKNWKIISGRKSFTRTYIEKYAPEDWEEIQAQHITLDEYEKKIIKSSEALAGLKEFAQIWRASYSPLFQFRDSLFSNLEIYDPHGFLLDELDRTFLDPIHLLRYYEFEVTDELIQLTAFAADIYTISFRLRYYDTCQYFVNNDLNKLTAFPNIQIKRQIGDIIRPTPLVKELEKGLFPGVIICPRTNAAAIFQMRKQGISSYPINVECNDGDKTYEILPGLSGILAIAIKFKQLKLPDDECFII